MAELIPLRRRMMEDNSPQHLARDTAIVHWRGFEVQPVFSPLSQVLPAIAEWRALEPAHAVKSAARSGETRQQRPSRLERDEFGLNRGGIPESALF